MFRVFEISTVWLHFIWPNLGFAGSCEYLLNKSAQKPRNFLLFKNLSGAWTHKTDRGYEAIMITSGVARAFPGGRLAHPEGQNEEEKK